MIPLPKAIPVIHKFGLCAALIAVAYLFTGCGGSSSTNGLGYRLTPDGGIVQPIGNNSVTLGATAGSVSSAVGISAQTGVAGISDAPVPSLTKDTPPTTVKFLGVPTAPLGAPITLTLAAPTNNNLTPVIVTLDNGKVYALPTAPDPANASLPAPHVTGYIRINGQDKFSSSALYEVVYISDGPNPIAALTRPEAATAKASVAAPLDMSTLRLIASNDEINVRDLSASFKMLSSIGMYRVSDWGNRHPISVPTSVVFTSN